MTTISQPLHAKIGEIDFRKKLVKQHFGTQQPFSQEYTSDEMQKQIKQKLIRAKNDFTHLKQKGICLSPFLEIGAGYGQTSLFLTNQFSADGFATDIAVDPLLTISKIQKQYVYKNRPQLLVCDAENLPFANNSFPFIFCYQTLHHFPHPLCVTKEIYRVLSPGGYFFFAEEPIKQIFNLNLWYRPTKLRWWEKLLKYTLILPFISKIGKTEIDHQIIEEAFSLKAWHQALDVFDHVESKLTPFPLGPQGQLKKIHNNWQPLNWLDRFNRLWLFFLGGGIQGLAKKGNNITDTLKQLPKLACVNCWIKKNQYPDRPHLVRKFNHLVCPNCNIRYSKINNIFILLPKKLAKRLYE